MLRILVRNSQGYVISTLELSDIVSASDIVNALRRKPVTTVISKAVLSGSVVVLSYTRATIRLPSLG